MASQQLVFVGGNNVTLSQSLDALSLSATMTISGGNSYSAGMSNIGNISGTSGLVSKQLVLAGGNNITLSQSVNGGSATVTISAGAGGTGGVPTLSIWQNASRATDLLLFGLQGAVLFSVYPLDPNNDVFPGNMTVNTMYVNVNLASVTDSILTLFTTVGSIDFANSGTLSIYIYTRNASTLSLLNSVATTWGFNSTDTHLFSGTRWITIHSSLWSTSPTFSQTEYYVGQMVSVVSSTYTNTTVTTTGIRGQFVAYQYLLSSIRSGIFGVSTTTGDNSMRWYPWFGYDTISSATIAINDTVLRKTNNIPHLMFENISSNF